jgi:hypothetical protein
VCLSLVLTIPAFSQTLSSSSQAQTLLQNSLAALTRRQSITDVTLSGSAHRIAGSDDESGTFLLRAVSAGSSRLDLTLSQGPRSEIRSVSSTSLAGSWSGPDGTIHTMPLHNLLTDAWYFPTSDLEAAMANQNYVQSFIATETQNSASVQHLRFYEQSLGKQQSIELTKHLSTVDLYLDSSTLLPVSVSLNTHPDDNGSLDISVQILFSDYRTVSGALFPFHIQKYLNGTLLLDLQVQSVATNTGLSASLFNVQ